MPQSEFRERRSLTRGCGGGSIYRQACADNFHKKSILAMEASGGWVTGMNSKGGILTIVIQFSSPIVSDWIGRLRIIEKIQAFCRDRMLGLVLDSHSVATECNQIAHFPHRAKGSPSRPFC